MKKLNPTIDLNSAGVAQLTQLPGVAKNLAYKIVNYRRHHGGFSSWADFERAADLSAAKLSALKKRAFLGPRQPPAELARRVISRWQGKSKHDGLHVHG